MDWPVDLKPYRCEFFLQNRSSVFRSPLTGSRQVLGRQGARWVCTISLKFVGMKPEYRRQAQRMDALLAKMKGQLNTVDLWDFARPTPAGPNLDRTSIPLTTFADVGPPTTTIFTDGTMFSGGAAGRRVFGGYSAGVESVPVSGFPAGTTQIYAGDYVEIGGWLYMLTEDAVADSNGRAPFALNRGLVGAVAHNSVPVFEYASTPMQLVDDDQPNRSVGLAQIYEYTLSFVEAL